MSRIQMYYCDKCGSRSESEDKFVEWKITRKTRFDSGQTDYNHYCAKCEPAIERAANLKKQPPKPT